MRSLANERPRARNQRVSNTRQRRQQHLLDVKVRSHKATQHRNKRLLVIASKVLLGALICGGLVFGVRFGSRRLFLTTPTIGWPKSRFRPTARFSATRSWPQPTCVKASTFSA